MRTPHPTLPTSHLTRRDARAFNTELLNMEHPRPANSTTPAPHAQFVTANQPNPRHHVVSVHPSIPSLESEIRRQGTGRSFGQTFPLGFDP
jgi:hypothetical protein